MVRQAHHDVARQAHHDVARQAHHDVVRQAHHDVVRQAHHCDFPARSQKLEASGYSLTNPLRFIFSMRAVEVSWMACVTDCGLYTLLKDCQTKLPVSMA